MGRAVQISVEMPEDLAEFRLPESVQARLQDLLDQQDAGVALSAIESKEAEALVDLADFLTLLRMRAERASSK